MTNKEAAEKIEFYKKTYWRTDDVDKNQVMDMAVEALKNKKTDWIPTSERNPDKDGFYLATLDGEICGEGKPFAGMAEFANGKWVDDESDYKCVLAWIKMPEPWK